jgi:hypothetical protein
MPDAFASPGIEASIRPSLSASASIVTQHSRVGAGVCQIVE